MKPADAMREIAAIRKSTSDLTGFLTRVEIMDLGVTLRVIGPKSEGARMIGFDDFDHSRLSPGELAAHHFGELCGEIELAEKE